jgi:hypothetical protein
LQQHENQRKNCQKREKTKFEILTAMEKSVEMPEILGPWHNDNQDSGEQEEQAASQGVGLRDAIDRLPYRCGSTLQSASRSDSIMHYLRK